MGQLHAADAHAADPDGDRRGNIFANPGLVIFGNVAVMVALVAAAAVAALWQPARLGAAVLAGALIPMAAQAISALIQVSQGVSPAQFGISPAGAAQLGLTITSGLTPAFWIYFALVIALAGTCAWMLLQGRPQRPEGDERGHRPGGRLVAGVAAAGGPPRSWPRRGGHVPATSRPPRR